MVFVYNYVILAWSISVTMETTCQVTCCNVNKEVATKTCLGVSFEVTKKINFEPNFAQGHVTTSFTPLTHNYIPVRTHGHVSDGFYLNVRSQP